MRPLELSVLGYPAFSNRAENPYNWLLYSHVRALGVGVQEYTVGRALTGAFSILHLHWPDRRVRDPKLFSALARSGALIALLDAVHARGMSVVWTVHNLESHGGRVHAGLERWYWRSLARRVDGFTSLGPSAVTASRERFPELRGKPGFAIPHGELRGVYPDEVGRTGAREALGIAPDRRVAAFFGQIREYKNVIRLVSVFRALRDPDAVLLIAGKPKPAALAEDIRLAAGDDRRVRVFPGFVPDDRIQLYLRASDLVVLPYREILNSGSAVLALSFECPVLVPRKGGMADLEEQVGTEWVRTYDGEFTSQVLADALAWATRPDRPVKPPMTGMEWDRIARRTVDAYHAVMETRAS